VKKPCNGWTSWKNERGPGDWVFLDELQVKKWGQAAFFDRDKATPVF